MYEPYGNRTPPRTRHGRTARRRAAAANVRNDYVNLVVASRVLSVYKEPLHKSDDGGRTPAGGQLVAIVDRNADDGVAATVKRLPLQAGIGIV